MNNYFTFNQIKQQHPFIQTLCDSINNNLLFLITTFLPYPDLIKFKHLCKDLHRAIGKDVIKHYVQEGCVTVLYRKDYYRDVINYSKMQSLIMKELNSFKFSKEELYKKILELSEVEKQKGNKVFIKICEEIGRDLDRTFYTDKFVKGNGRELLKNILTSLGYIRPEIGYCQGMNFIGGALINFLEDDDEFCFWLFLTLIDDLELNLLYLKNMPDYSIRVYQLNFYINQYMPDLLTHFNKNQINPDIILSKWILTIFSSYLPFETLAKVWDVFLIDKWKAIFKFSLAFLYELYDNLIIMDLNSLSQFFRENSRKLHLNYDIIKANYSRYKITNKQIDQLREEFFADQVKIKLEDPYSKWEPDQESYVKNYLRDVEALDKLAKKNTKGLQEKIELSNKDLRQAFESHQRQYDKYQNLKIKINVMSDTIDSYEKVVKNSVQEKSKMEEEHQHNHHGVIEDDGLNHHNHNNVPFGQQVKSMLNKYIKNSKSKKESASNAKDSPIPEINHSYTRKEKPLKEIEKIEKKKKQLNKDMSNTNTLLNKNFDKLDKKKIILEMKEKENTALKESLKEAFDKNEKDKRVLLKDLSIKLKLTSKFVKTSKF